MKNGKRRPATWDISPKRSLSENYGLLMESNPLRRPPNWKFWVPKTKGFGFGYPARPKARPSPTEWIPPQIGRYIPVPSLFRPTPIYMQGPFGSGFPKAVNLII